MSTTPVLLGGVTTLLNNHGQVKHLTSVFRTCCILSPTLFNLHSENIKKAGGVGNMVTGIRKLTWIINTITHADYTTVLVESKDDMIGLIKWVKYNSDRAGLNLKIQKSIVLSTVEKVNIFSNGENFSTVTNCSFWWFSSPTTDTPMKRSRKE
jgi:hypothetical protein